MAANNKPGTTRRRVRTRGMRRLANCVGHEAVEHQQGEEGDAGLERRIVVDRLEEVGEEEKGAEHADDGKHDGQERPGTIPVPQDAKWYQRVRPLALPQDERAEQDGGCHKKGLDVGRSPTARAGLSEPVDEGDEAAAAEDHAEHVESNPRCPLTIRDHREGAEEDESGDGQIDVQAPAPIDVLGQEATEDEPEGRAGDANRGVDPKGPSPFTRIGEGRGQERQHRRGQEGAEETLHAAGAYQHDGGLGGAADGRGQGEADDPGHQHTLRAEHVADAPAQEEEPAEGQRVGSHDPLSIGIREPRARAAPMAGR